MTSSKKRRFVPQCGNCFHKAGVYKGGEYVGIRCKLSRARVPYALKACLKWEGEAGYKANVKSKT